MTLRADGRLDEAPMLAVECRRCAARVLVRKSSWNQTSVQWDAAASASCLERSEAERLTGPNEHGIFFACSALRDSITDAVRQGELPIVDETGPAT